MRRFLSVLVSMALASAQKVGQNKQSGATTTATFQTSATLVIETVTIKDKSGNPVEGLTAKDFTITEDGVPQVIKFFEFQKLNTPENVAPPPPPPAPRVLPQRLAHTQIAAETPGDVKYRDRRLLALYFDMTAMPETDQLRALSAARKFIKTQMTSLDLMAIMQYQGGAVQVLQDFTGDKELLENTLNILIVGEAQGLDEMAADAST